MLGRIPHQKFCFYHLPTRGRAGIKLGDASYVSNVSIICFGCFIGINMLYYMIFGTNLLTQSLVSVSAFFLVFEFYRKGITNGVQLTCQFLMIFYGPKEAPRVKELGQKSLKPSTRMEREPSPLGAPPASWIPR